MGRRGGFDERARCFGVGVQGDSDDRQTGWFELVIEGLPPGQFEATASVRGPRQQQNLPPS